MAEPYSQGIAAYAVLFPRAAHELAQLVAAVQASGARQVVDLGAGLGVSALGLAEAGMSVTAIEPDPEMATALTTRLALQPALQPRVALLPGSQALPAACADAVLCQSVLHLLPAAEQVALLIEAARLLQPGGTVWIEAPFESPARAAVPWGLVAERQLGATRLQHHRAMGPQGAAWVTEWRFETWLGEQLLHQVVRRFEWVPLQEATLKTQAQAAGLLWGGVFEAWDGRNAFDASRASYGFARLSKPPA